MATITGLIIGILIGTLFNALIIWIVAKLGLGIEVSGFGAAIIAALVIGIVAGLITWLLSLFGVTAAGGLIGAIVHLIIAAIVLMIADNFVKGLKVHGFSGALIAAIAMAVVAWLINWAIGLVL